jgi:Dolichyl-phosphate-mannose-protein mannosyltransferase
MCYALSEVTRFMVARQRRIVSLATAFMLGGLALRLPLLGRSIWRDEGSTYAVVAVPSLHALLSHVWTTEMTPPLYYLIEYGWTHLAGVAETAMRTPSLLFGLATIVIMYALGRRVAGMTGAIAGAFCAAFSPLAIELDVEARAYAFALLLSAVFLYSYAVCVTSVRARRGWQPLPPATSFLEWQLLGPLQRPRFDTIARVRCLRSPQLARVLRRSPSSRTPFITPPTGAAAAFKARV